MNTNTPAPIVRPRPLDPRTAPLFDRLFTLADLAPDGAIKLDRHRYDPDRGGIMPTCVELLPWMGSELYDFYSVAHYYVQNGDAMRDPEVIFARAKAAPDATGPRDIWPTSYRQDGMGIDATYLTFDGPRGEMDKVSPRGYADVWRFCRMWGRNIKDQQAIDPRKPIPAQAA